MSNLDIFPTAKISPYLIKIPSISSKIVNSTEEYGELVSSLDKEVSRRKELLRSNKARTIYDYNLTHEAIPHVVVVINSINDIWSLYGVDGCHGLLNLVMSVHGVGIHIWLTSRSVLRKQSFYELLDCFNDKIIFKLSEHDSKYLLGCNDAYSLSGKGDMLYCDGDVNLRAQIPTIDSFEVNICAKKIRNEYGIDSFYKLAGDESEAQLSDLDPMFQETADLVVETGQGSITMIQRKFCMGYNRAARIMDQLEIAGIVCPYTGSHNRAVLIDSPKDLLLILQYIYNDRNEKTYKGKKRFSGVDSYNIEQPTKTDIYLDNIEDSNRKTNISSERITSTYNSYKGSQTKYVKPRTNNDNGYCFLILFVFILIIVLGYFFIVSPLITFFSKETKFEKKKRLMREARTQIIHLCSSPSIFDY